MNRIFYYILFILLILFYVNITFWYKYIENINWNSVKIFKITKDDDYKVVVSVSKNWDSLEKLIKNVWGVAWINWSYFCPKDYNICNWRNFSDWDRISNWIIYSKWNNTWNRYIFWFSHENIPLIHKSPSIHPDNFEWIYNWISNFPLILKEWESSLDEFDSLIDDKMKIKWLKNFICSTKSWNIFMWHIYNQTMESMVDFLKDLGCFNALNLDSWWSLSLYDDNYKRGPWRDIMDAFVIVKKENNTNNLKIKESKKEIIEENDIIKSNVLETNKVYFDDSIINNEKTIEREKNIFDKMSDKYNLFIDNINDIKNKIFYYIDKIKLFISKLNEIYNNFINFFS